MKVWMIIALALGWSTQMRAQNLQVAISALETVPFNCEAFLQTVRGAQGYQLLANEYSGDAIIGRLLEVGDSRCRQDFMHYYAWDIVHNGDPETPPRTLAPSPAARQPTCLPSWMRFGRPCPSVPQAEPSQSHDQIVASHQRRREQTLRNLRRLNSARFGDASVLSSGQNLMCLPVDQGIDLFLGAAEQNREIFSCLRPAVGETKVMNFDDHDVPSGNGLNYAIRNTGNNNHDVLIPMQLRLGSGATVGTEEMMARVRGCLAQANQYMLGPNNQRLTLRVLDDQELASLPAHQRPRPNVMNILAPGIRGNRDNYASDFDCPTIIHEVLHVVGLCDEYREREPGVPGSCRAHPDIPSIMVDHQEAFSLTAGQTLACSCGPHCQSVLSGSNEARRKFYLAPRLADLLTQRDYIAYCRSPYDIDVNLQEIHPNTPVPRALELVEQREDGTMKIYERTDLVELYQERTYFCSCNGARDHAQCQDTLSKLRRDLETPARLAGADLRNCPNGGSPTRRTFGLNGEHMAFNPAESTLTVVQPPQLPSLLHPSHFDRVIGGYCPSVTPQYNECARWSQVDLRGPDGQLTNECPGRPVQCSDPAYFLGVQ